jgi:hypothetical protein
MYLKKWGKFFRTLNYVLLFIIIVLDVYWNNIT